MEFNLQEKQIDLDRGGLWSYARMLRELLSFRKVQMGGMIQDFRKKTRGYKRE
jgi:hypothetical protein